MQRLRKMSEKQLYEHLDNKKTEDALFSAVYNSMDTSFSYKQFVRILKTLNQIMEQKFFDYPTFGKTEVPNE